MNPELTPEVGEELKGLDARRASAKAKAKQILQLGLDNKAASDRIVAEREQQVGRYSKDPRARA